MTLRIPFQKPDAVTHDSTPRAIRFPPGSKKRSIGYVKVSSATGDGGAAYRRALKGKMQTKNGVKVQRER